MGELRLALGNSPRRLGEKRYRIETRGSGKGRKVQFQKPRRRGEERERETGEVK